MTTVTFGERDGKALLVVQHLYLSKDALDAAFASGSTGGLPEQLDQLDGSSSAPVRARTGADEEPSSSLTSARRAEGGD